MARSDGPLLHYVFEYNTWYLIYNASNSGFQSFNWSLSLKKKGMMPHDLGTVSETDNKH